MKIVKWLDRECPDGHFISTYFRLIGPVVALLGTFVMRVPTIDPVSEKSAAMPLKRTCETV
jgi:hypothetical protein